MPLSMMMKSILLNTTIAAAICVHVVESKLRAAQVGSVSACSIRRLAENSNTDTEEIGRVVLVDRLLDDGTKVGEGIIFNGTS